MKMIICSDGFTGKDFRDEVVRAITKERHETFSAARKEMVRDILSRGSEYDVIIYFSSEMLGEAEHVSRTFGKKVVVFTSQPEKLESEDVEILSKDDDGLNDLAIRLLLWTAGKKT